MASGLMCIKYSDNGIDSSVSSAYNKLDGITDALDRVRSKLNSLPERSSRNNLESASAFLRKKAKQYETKKTALDVLKQRSDTFMSHVETTEKQLSASIKQEYKQFHNQTGIGKTVVAVIGEALVGVAKKLLTYLIPIYGQYQLVKDIFGAAAKIGESIKNWYNGLPEGLRYTLNVVGSIIAVAVATIAVVASFGAVAAATGIVATIFAGCTAAGALISAVDAGIGLLKTGTTLTQYARGNKAVAREIDAMSNAEATQVATGLSPDIYNGITTAGGILSLVGGIGTFGTKVASGATKLMSDGKGAGKAIGQSLKTESLDKVKGLFDADDVGDLKGYLSESGGFKNGMKNLFTTDLSKLISSKAQSDALKGIKAIYKWVKFEPISDINGIVNANNPGTAIYNAIQLVF